MDMSLSIVHHGHIRLLKKASELGYVIVALCTVQPPNYVPFFNRVSGNGGLMFRDW